ncbi:SLATT domain-containing protein [Kutzneria buriramensis]|nr:SLATT domain-containing protein [Kutzneria buriramensis]
MREPIQSELPDPGLSPLDLAKDVLARIERGNEYARRRKRVFRQSSTVVKSLGLGMSAVSTVILGLQNLNFWTGIGFVLVALLTVVNTLEPFFAWRSRWVLMEETQSRFHTLRDSLSFYLASTPVDQLDQARITEAFAEYQRIWGTLGERWLEFRRVPGQ